MKTKKKVIEKKPILLKRTDDFFHINFYSGSNLSNSNILIGSYKKEYVPLFFISIFKRNICNEYTMNNFYKKFLYYKYRNTNYNDLINFIIGTDEKRNDDLINISYIKNNLKLSKVIIENWIKKPFVYSFPEINHSTLWYRPITYKRILNTFFNGDIFKNFKKTNGLKYIIGPYFIAKVDGVNIIPLVCIVTKPKYIHYLKASHILNESVTPDVLELWVKDDFDTINTTDKGLRMWYRKHIKKYFQEHGVSIVNKEHNFLDEFILKAEIPSFEDIEDYRQWNDNISSDFINHLKKENKDKLSSPSEVMFDNVTTTI